MGIDISHIVRNDFTQVEDEKASLSYAKKTIEKLKKNLSLPSENDFGLHQYNFDNEKPETLFNLPLYDLEFTLHNGFWQIESYFHYCQIVMHQEDCFWLRRTIFDVVKALGEKEAWHAAEYYTWNREGGDNPEITFEQWMDYILKETGGVIPEFNQKEIMEQGNVCIPEYESIYHDSFEECHNLYDNIQSKVQDKRLIGLYRIGEKYLRFEKDKKIYLCEEDTTQPLFKEPIENILTNLNGPEFVIQKNGLSAVFDGRGKQLTEFTKGVFEWRWHSTNKPSDNQRVIFNNDAGIILKR